MNIIINNNHYKLDRTFGNKILKSTKKVIKLYENVCPIRYEYTLKKLDKYCLCLDYAFNITSWYGMYCPGDDENTKFIEYSYDLLKDKSEEQLYLVVSHEMAHLFDVCIRGEGCASHDKHWRNIISLLNGQPRSCIDLSPKTYII